jgi:hypothetical protein
LFDSTLILIPTLQNTDFNYGIMADQSDQRVANAANPKFMQAMSERPKAFGNDLTVSIHDMLQLGSMYLPSDGDDIWDDSMRVAVDSVVYRALVLLGKDPGFRAAMKLDDTTFFDAYEQYVDADTGIHYIINVPSECVWCAISFVKNLFFVGVEGGSPDYFVGMTRSDMYRFLHRIAFDAKSIENIMIHYDSHPQVVTSILNAITSQSVHSLVANELQKNKEVPDVHPAVSETEQAPEQAEQTVEKPLVIPNNEVCKLVCQEIRTKLPGTPMAEMLCEHVTDVLDAFSRHGTETMHIANMDGYAQAKLFNATIAQAIVYGYALSGPNNKYNERIMNALLLIDEPQAAEKTSGNDNEEAKRE